MSDIVQIPRRHVIHAEDWPHPDSLADLASVYKELQYMEFLDRQVMDYRPINGRPQDPRSRSGSAKYSMLQTFGAWRSAAERIDEQREALRARATFLSRGKTRDVKLMDLSTEILLMIVKQFQYSEPLEDEAGKGTLLSFPDAETVKSLRLVSRLFHRLATPLLLPILNLVVDRKSLDQVRCISDSPLFASGVLAIRIGIEYRPTVLQRSFDRFLEYHEEAFSSHRDELTTELAKLRIRRAKLPRTCQNWLVTGLQFHENNINESIERSHFVQSATRRFLAAEDANSDVNGDGLDEVRVTEYMKLLKLCHSEYEQIYNEQSELISNGSFINAIALLVSQLRRPIMLDLYEIEPGMSYRGIWESKTAFRSTYALLSSLKAPVSWSNIRFAAEDEQNLAVRLIYDLTPAIHEAGGKLDALRLACPPLAHHFGTIQRRDPLSSGWDELRAASQSLRVLYLPYIHFAYHTSLSSNSETNLDIFEDYFIALLSGQNLQRVCITASANIEVFSEAETSSFPMGKLLANINWSQIKRVKLVMISITQIQVERFFQSLSNNMEELILKRLHLSHGSWVRALDILREKVMGIHTPEDSNGGCSSSVIVLEGGEILQLDENKADKIIGEYVRGEGEAGNPLVRYALI